MKPTLFFVATLTIGGGVLSVAPQAATKPPANPPTASPSDPQAVEFFEKQVRPVLVARCLSCHGPDKQRGGLRLDSRKALLKGGDSGPVLAPGNPDQSLLIRVLRHDGDVKMPPPPKSKLTDAQVAAFTTWVRRGAPWPAAVTVKAPLEGRALPWSFQPVRQPRLPVVKNAGWVRTPVDSFILDRLEAQGLAPSSPADKYTLLRRVTFDLIGLPPTPEEITAFLEDRSLDAFAKVVDRLLASPHYGERWGRHWLDLVHYADDEDISDFSEIWLYRDWVTKAFNRDLPYTDFLTLQIAGDLLQSSQNTDEDAMDAIIATGLLGMTQFDNTNLDFKLMNAEYVDDQVDIVGRAFLGLTLSCARCHDHKFDPISTEDYYALAGFFFNTRPVEQLQEGPRRVRVPLVSKEEKLRRELRQKRENELRSLQSAFRAWAALSGQVVGLLGTSNVSGPLLTISALNPTRTAKLIPFNPKRLVALQKELKTLQEQSQKSFHQAHQAIAVRDGGLALGGFKEFRDAHIYIRGDPHSPGKIVPRGFPRALGGEQLGPIKQGSGRQLLARWLTRADNPLTARVMVNRLWQHHFGEGIVRTSNNFGELGERPTHPELLDYLAARFVQSGWSLKAMHRLTLLSATYQQSSSVSLEAYRKDPDNRSWGRMNRQRLESEAIRDSLLSVAGRLDLKQGGLSFLDMKVPRRTHYFRNKRSYTPYFSFIFDQPNPSLICEKRATTTVSPQTLFFLNDPFVAEQAKALANRLETREKSQEEKIKNLYLLCLGRLPTRMELDSGLRFLAQETVANSWSEYCQAIFCINEFIYVD